MIKISIFRNGDNQITGFKCSGHARYAAYGHDIVCTSVSILVLNTINSIEKFTDDKFTCNESAKSGKVYFKLKSSPSDGTKLLLNSLVLGLTSIIKEYGDGYIKLTFKEV